MSRIIGKLPSTLPEKEGSEDENEVETVFADESLSIFPCYPLYPRRTCSLSVSGNSAKLKLIDLNGIKKKEANVAPIKRKDARIRQDPFKKYKIPDEIIDVIFSSLRKRDLLSAMLVCKKFRAVGNQSKNWTVTDVMDRPVSELSLIKLMERKIRILRLAGAKPDPSFRVDSRMFAKCMLSVSRLEFLDLSRANLTQRQLMIMLRPCRKLLCLSLEGNLLDDQVATYIADNTNLRELDISMTHGITVDGARIIFENCKNLMQLNASWCGMTRPILNVLFECMSEKIQKLTLSGSVRNYGLNNEHIEALSNKSANLLDLDVSDNVELGDAAVATIMCRFPKLTHLSLNRCYGVDPNIIVQLNNKPTLKNLNVHGCITESNTELFLQICDRLKIDSQFFNFTAKPVRYLSNTSQIWGHNMLED